MKLDLYTKGILTVIGLSLVVIAFKDISPVSDAFANGDCATSSELASAKRAIINTVIAWSD